MSLTVLKNRVATADIDYILDPATKNEAKMNEKLKRAIRAVASAKGYHPEWVNDRVTGFVYDDTAGPLVQRSVQQHVLLYRSKNLNVFAVEWEWSLARKLRRVATQNRDVDIDDAAVTLHKIVQQRGHPMERQEAKDYWKIVKSAIEDRSIDLVNTRYREHFGTDGFVSNGDGQGQAQAKSQHAA